jgi:hypothetical protein
LNHPELDARIQEMERRRKEERQEMIKKTAPVVGLGVKALIKILTGLLQNQAKPNFTNTCSLLCPNSVT